MAKSVIMAATDPDAFEFILDFMADPDPGDFVDFPDFQAAGAQDGKRLPRFNAVVYGGGEMRVAGWQTPIVVSLAGLEIPPKIIICKDHDTTFAGLLGHGEARVEKGFLVAAGTVSATNDAAKQFVSSSQNGFPFQVSIGAQALERTFIRPGESVAVNGRHLTAGRDGLTVVTKAVLKEISILGLGADADTVVNVAARDPKQGDAIMPEPKTEELVASAKREERERLAKIDAALAGLPADKTADLRARAVAESLSLEGLQREALDILRAERPKAPATHLHTRSLTAEALRPDVLAAAALHLMGRDDLLKDFPPEAAEAGRQFRHALDLAEACLQADGREPPRGAGAIVQAAFSTLSLPTALTESAQRIVLVTLAAQPPTILQIARSVDVPNFKTTEVLSPVLRQGFQKVAPDGELKHGVLDEELYSSLKADTYGEVFNVSRQDVVNDDLGVIPQLVEGLTRNAFRALNDLGWAVVMANAAAWFSEDHGNLLEGIDTTLTVDGLGQTIRAFREQTDAAGRPIDVSPSILAVPPALETWATALMSSAEIARYVADGTDQQPTGNPWKNRLTPLVEPRLGNAKFTGHSDKAWYLFSAAAVGAVVVAFVNGGRAPTIEQVDMPANVLGIGWRGFWDFAVALGDWRLALKAKGEA